MASGRLGRSACFLRQSSMAAIPGGCNRTPIVSPLPVADEQANVTKLRHNPHAAPLNALFVNIGDYEYCKRTAPEKEQPNLAKAKPDKHAVKRIKGISINQSDHDPMQEISR